MSSNVEIGISFYVLPIVFNLLPISLCYDFNGSFFDLKEVTEGYFDSPEVVPRCFGIWRALGAYPWLSFDHKNNHLQYCDNISFENQNNQCCETCRGSCIGTFWHRRIRRASTIYQAETIITPLMIKTTMMMAKFKLKFVVMIDIKVVDWKVSP